MDVLLPVTLTFTGDDWGWVLPVCGALTILVGGIAAVVKLLGWFMAFQGRINDFIEDWRGEKARPGISRRLGVPERLSIIESRMQAIERQITPNGGTSVQDKLSRIEDTLGSNEDTRGTS